MKKKRIYITWINDVFSKRALKMYGIDEKTMYE
jgi:hypothetical protein